MSKVKFISKEPNLVVFDNKSRREVCRFNSKCEFITDNPELITRLSRFFDSRPLNVGDRVREAIKPSGYSVNLVSNNETSEIEPETNNIEEDEVSKEDEELDDLINEDSEEELDDSESDESNESNESEENDSEDDSEEEENNETPESSEDDEDDSEITEGIDLTKMTKAELLLFAETELDLELSPKLKNDDIIVEIGKAMEDLNNEDKEEEATE